MAEPEVEAALRAELNVADTRHGDALKGGSDVTQHFVGQVMNQKHSASGRNKLTTTSGGPSSPLSLLSLLALSELA